MVRDARKSALLTMRGLLGVEQKLLPHPDERPLGRVSKDDCSVSWFETAQERLLT
jgi:hypothetical protein